MRFEGTARFRAPTERVHRLLSDPRVVMDCFLEPHKVEVVDATHFQGEAAVGIAFLRGTFRFIGEYLPVESSHRIRVRFHGSGMGSEVDAELGTELTRSSDGRYTQVGWTVNLALQGAARTLGDWLVRRTVEEKIGTFFDMARHRAETG